MLFEGGIGIDFSDSHLRLAWLRHDGAVRALKEVKLPLGLVIDDQISKTQLLQSHLQELMNDPDLAGMKGKVTVLIPESRVFVGTFWMDTSMKKTEIEKTVLDRGQKIIPMPFRSAIVDLEYGAKIEEKQAVAVITTAKESVESVEQAFSILQMPITALESNNAAVYRLVKDHLDGDVEQKLKMIVDVGTNWANFSFLDVSGLPIFTRSLRLDVTEKLSAEVTKEICAIILETIQYFRGVSKEQVAVFFSGQAEKIKAALPVCQPILKGHIVSSVGETATVEGVDSVQAQNFAAAIGAALRSVRPKKYNYQHNFKEAFYEA